jgi:hypothetical protein
VKSLVVREGDTVQLFSGEALVVNEYLPKGIYELCFSPKMGYFLKLSANDVFNLTKIYGEVLTWADHVITSFLGSKGNLGALFSGPTGLGKSLAIKYIVSRLYSEQHMPVIYIKENMGDFVSFFDSLSGPCVVVLDEFEKMYINSIRDSHENLIYQNDILNLFDSHFDSHKLFLLSVNEINALSPYLLNRPGRIRYHFMVRSVSREAIRGYCEDKLVGVEDREKVIKEVIHEASKIATFSYDMLDALVSEINLYPDRPVSEAVKFLNIGSSMSMRYLVQIHYTNGEIFTTYELCNINRPELEVGWYDVDPVSQRSSSGHNVKLDTGKAQVLDVGPTGCYEYGPGSFVYYNSRHEEPRFEVAKVVFMPVEQRDDFRFGGSMDLYHDEDTLPAKMSPVMSKFIR